MANFKVIQTNLSSGELSPEAVSRVDIARYNNGAKRTRNIISKTLGGGKKRPGTEYLAKIKDVTKESRMLPFVVSQTEGYMLEVGEAYCRVFTPDGAPVLSGGSPYEFANNYTEAQVQEVDYSQSDTGMYLFHEAIYPNRLRRAASDSWNCSAAPFTTIPFGEIGDYPAAALTLSLATVGTGRTATASAAVFLASDVGRAITWKNGIAVITGYTSTTVVTVEIKVAFESTAVPTGTWNLDSSPQTTLTLSAPAATPSMDPPGSPVTATLSAAGFRTTDIGKHVRINGGLIKLTAHTSTTVMTGEIVIQVTSVIGAPSLSWSLEAPVWSSSRGYPRTGTVYKQRLVAAGTDGDPQTIHGSRLGEELDFTRGTNDDDGFAFTISGNDSQVNLINFLVSTRDLLALSYGGEYVVTGGGNKVVTPTNVDIQLQSAHGSQQVRPATVGRQIVFAQRAGRKLRAMSYSFQDDGYPATDLTTLAEHITETGIKRMAFQQEPDPVLWIVLNNGRMIAATIEKELDIIAFNVQETEGAFEDVAVMPNGDLEQVWFIVRRSINGAITRYVERLQPNWYPIYGTASPDPDVFPPQDEPFNWGFQLDCALSLDDAVAKTVWTGLDHLEGETVKVIADGYAHIDCVVAAGSITLQKAANRILVGLMFRPEIQLLTPEIQSANGTVQTSAMSTNEFTIRVKDTIGTTVDGQELIPVGKFNSTPAGTPPQPQTGDFSVSKLGWSRSSTPTISQDHPFPFHFLAAIRHMTFN